MTDLVFRARRGAVWHWPHPNHPDRSACCRTPLDLVRDRDPIAVDIDDRCPNNGCAVRWDGWLRATALAALADCVDRWHRELHGSGRAAA